MCQRNKPYFDSLFSPLWYESPVSEWIVSFKYSNQWENVTLLINLFTNKCTVRRSDAILLPVPSHAKRVRTRGFNPVHEFVRLLKRQIAIEYLPNIVRRVCSTDTQTGKTHRERCLNVKNAFKVIKNLGGKNVILFDDVVTTGATVNEISKCLKKHGAGNIDVWAIARTRQNFHD